MTNRLSLNKSLIKPPALRPGDSVAIIAPSSRPAKPSDLARAQHIIETMGFVPVAGKHVLATNGYMAGTDDERLEDLSWALTDVNIRAVWAITGGYGALRLLEKLPYQKFQESPKIFLGSDDANLLVLALHQITGVVTFHAPNLDRVTAGATASNLAKFLAGQVNAAAPYTVESEDASFIFAPVPLAKGESAIKTGSVLPCNLTALVSLFGTKFEPNLDGALLLLEDRAERNDILDRWLTTLYISGKLARASAVGFGSFEKCDTRGANNMLSFEELASDRLVQMGLPCCFELAFGQSAKSAIVPCGLSASLDITRARLSFDQSAFI